MIQDGEKSVKGQVATMFGLNYYDRKPKVGRNITQYITILGVVIQEMNSYNSIKRRNRWKK